VTAFHRRPLKNRYKVLMLDGVVLARKTGAGALRRPVLVALGLRPDGKKEVIDFRLAGSESGATRVARLPTAKSPARSGGGTHYTASFTGRLANSHPFPHHSPAPLVISGNHAIVIASVMLGRRDRSAWGPEA
jgi:hypothetical protein